MFVFILKLVNNFGSNDDRIHITVPIMERKLFRHLRLRLRATKQAFIIVPSLVCKTHYMMVLVVTISMTALSKVP